MPQITPPLSVRLVGRRGVRTTAVPSPKTRASPKTWAVPSPKTWAVLSALGLLVLAFLVVDAVRTTQVLDDIAEVQSAVDESATDIAEVQSAIPKTWTAIAAVHSAVDDSATDRNVDHALLVDKLNLIREQLHVDAWENGKNTGVWLRRGQLDTVCDEHVNDYSDTTTANILDFHTVSFAPYAAARNWTSEFAVLATSCKTPSMDPRNATNDAVVWVTMEGLTDIVILCPSLHSWQTQAANLSAAFQVDETTPNHDLLCGVVKNTQPVRDWIPSTLEARLKARAGPDKVLGSRRLEQGLASKRRADGRSLTRQLDALDSRPPPSFNAAARQPSANEPITADAASALVVRARSRALAQTVVGRALEEKTKEDLKVVGSALGVVAVFGVGVAAVAAGALAFAGAITSIVLAATGVAAPGILISAAVSGAAGSTALVLAGASAGASAALADQGTFGTSLDDLGSTQITDE